MSDRTYAALIPARGGSKGIKKKNIVDVAGKPLIAHSIEAAQQSDTIDDVVVSTDSQEIADVAAEWGASVPYLRPDKLATDEAPTEPVITHALEHESADEWTHVVLLQPTSPLRTGNDIENAIATFEQSSGTSLVSVFEDHSYRWEETSNGAIRKNYQGDRKRRQDKSPEYVENGAIYITKCSEFLKTGDIQAGKTILYTMPQKRSVDVDTHFDLWLVRKLIHRLNGQNDTG
ncbi:acylneuraminate cytidylyltransferase family protein [Halorubrum sodomense]|uniref:N-acylneuraminate cytidylyltransferase n=1 Tax=Halorubrum sodomense TaxID=35743 RepID=A0A1I6GYL6_HALSD|nr:acylneuraminate cytidylyltransferase family protein [Halorubrum sodomense]SFR47141.1 N-acylneuraminate cytidylyltransferase [Halorubrum sodomense]